MPWDQGPGLRCPGALVPGIPSKLGKALVRMSVMLIPENRLQEHQALSLEGCQPCWDSSVLDVSWCLLSASPIPFPLHHLHMVCVWDCCHMQNVVCSVCLLHWFWVVLNCIVQIKWCWLVVSDLPRNFLSCQLCVMMFLDRIQETRE
jgi:hypothetical protein